MTDPYVLCAGIGLAGYALWMALQAAHWRGKYHDLLDKMRLREQVYRRASERVRQSHDH